MRNVLYVNFNKNTVFRINQSLICRLVRRTARNIIADNKKNNPISLTIVNKLVSIKYSSTLLGHV